MGARRKPIMRRAHPVVALDDGTPVGSVVAAAVRAAHEGERRAAEAGIDRLTTAPDPETDTALDRAAGMVLTELYARGWQPADLARQVDPSHRPWAGSMIRRQMLAYPPDRVGERWAAQIDALDADPPSVARHDDIRTAVEVLGILGYLARLPVLMPPPGIARTVSRAIPAADARMLGKVRGLLAKAESTAFPGEAEAYTAKAQELMARYRIDHALVAGEFADPAAPIGVRVAVESPYADAKALLLHGVAEANGCQAVWSAEHRFSTVFGVAEDVEVVELLYTSLLVQGSTAMVREGSARHDDPARTKTFRQSFMHAYAIRIGTRLRAAAGSTAAGASDERLLPILARREREVRAEVERFFPYTTSKGRAIRVDNEAGWHRGTQFGDRAALGEG